MEKEIECQTEPFNITEEIKITEKMNNILTAYAKDVILYCPTDDNQSEEETKKKIYMWSKDYFRKLLDKDNKNISSTEDKETTCNNKNHTIKEKIKKEIEKANLKM